MALSERAQRLLQRATRYRARSERAEIVDLMRGLGWPAFEPVVVFEEQFGGLEYRVRGREDGLKLGLWFDADGPEHQGGKWFFACADHPTQQAWFRMDQAGAFYVDEVPLASSMTVWLESEAAEDELVDLQAKWWLVSFPCSHPEDDLVGRIELPPLIEATDELIRWWTDSRTRLVARRAGTPEDPRWHLRAWCSTPQAAEGLVRMLEAATTAITAEQPRVGLWPAP